MSFVLIALLFIFAALIAGGLYRKVAADGTYVDLYGSKSAFVIGASGIGLLIVAVLLVI